MTQPQPTQTPYFQHYMKLGEEIRQKAAELGYERGETYGEAFMEDIENQRLTLEILAMLQEKYFWVQKGSLAVSMIQIAVHIMDDTEINNRFIEDFFCDERTKRQHISD